MKPIPPALQIFFHCLMYAIAVDAFWGGIFSSKTAGVVIAGVNILWMMLSFMLPARKGSSDPSA